ncbi:helix-turn-helix domain-containing protein [Roseimaritima sediminicola]|uniref:helix-turn-helix domain-containing protein n=1 Tax=Roseimaritima sediminicola TaxID=2662066 RepID=UPI0012985563|nr:helix-turn-helix transcriptional regulator [Roseimaritima sediminicola]
MRYAFRLAELLGHSPDRRKRPGTIKAIVEHTGLDRHQVAALLKNEAKYIPLEALSKLCDYLIDHGHARPSELPGALFAVKPENFWETLARRKSIEICVGVRQDEADSANANAWVVASDSVLVGEMLNGISTLGGNAKMLSPAKGDAEEDERGQLAQPERLQQTLVWSPGHVSDEESHERARRVHQDFAEAQGDKALVCIGSVKSNPVAEMIFAEAFGCTPFASEDDLDDSSSRACPFFLRYREKDPKPNAASAGVQLSKNDKVDKPGIYYEQDDGTWVWAGGDKTTDAALVFYIYREPLGRFELVLSGFSGRATRLLAKTLASRSEEFWPPVYEEPGLQIGAYIVQYAVDEEDSDLLETDLSAAPKVIKLSAEAIRRRMERL